MTRSVTFGGQTQFKPGGLTRINADALTPIGISATGIVHLLGEADGGQPGTAGVVVVDDPALARSLFRSGPLADAIRVAFNPSGDPRIPGGAFRCVCYKTNASLQSDTSLPGDEAGVADTSTGASTTTVITVTTGGLVVDAHIGRWLQLDLSGEKRRIVDNDATTVTVSPGFVAAPVITDPVSILDDQIILTSIDYGTHTNQVSVELEPGVGEGVVVTLAFEDTVERSPEIAGESKLQIKYVGGPVSDSGTTETAAPTPTATVFEMSVAGTPLINAYAAQFIRFPDGSQRLITSHTAEAATPGFITVTLDAAHALSAAQVADLVSAGQAVEVINVTSATGSITGASGVATDFTSAVLPTADDLALDFATLGFTTLRQLVDHLNGNTNYEAVVPDGVNQDTTLLADYDFGDRNTAVDVRFDESIDINNKSTFRQDLVAVIDWVNEFSTLATAARANAGSDEGSELPAVTGGVAGTARDVPVYFVNGARGISSNASWQAGFDLLMESRGNHIVPLISEDLTNLGDGSTATLTSIAAQLVEHVKIGRTSGKNEMGGYFGMSGTKDELKAQIAAVNDTDVEVMGQQMAFLDAAGTLTLMDEWSSAVAAAGMRSGAPEVGEPLTFKFIGTTQLTQNSSWSPTSRTDVNELLEAGLMFAEVAPGGVRWVRDLTSHLKDDNIAFIDGNTRDAVRFIAYDLRTFLEDRFTGLKATPATVASIRESAAAKLQEYLEGNIIVESLDPETGTTTIPGFRRLRVFIEGNVATIRVEIFPVTGIVFQLNDIFLQLPRLAA